MKKIFGQMLLFSLFTLTFGVYATQLTWDAVSNGSTIDDGAWTWKVWVSTFNDGATSVVWATGSDVVIGNWWTAWVITVSGTVIPNSILFSPVSSNYTLSGGIIKLTNANTSITASWSTTPTINSVISGTGWLLKLGAWTLTLGGTNTYTGDTVISEWKIIVTNDSAFWMTGSISVNSWATLDISSLTFSWQDNIYSRTIVANGWTLITTIQTLAYDFESDTIWASPLDMSVEYKWLFRVWSIAGLNGKWVTAHTNSWAQLPISAFLTKFPAANDYSVTWLVSGSWAVGSWTNYKNGMILRAQPTPYTKQFYTWVRLWYLFQVLPWDSQAKIFKVWFSGNAQLVTTSITGITSYAPVRYKASTIGSRLSLHYSTISNKGPWNLLSSITDTSYAWWYTVYTDSWWWASYLKVWYIDDITMQYETTTTMFPDKLNAPSLLSMGDTWATFSLSWWIRQIDEYKITANPGSIVSTGISNIITIFWLTPNTTYTFTASAKNVGWSSVESDIYTGTTISPFATVIYSTTGVTSGNVTAMLTWLNGTIVTNNGWSDTYIFTENWSFTFNLDRSGTTGSTSAVVNWIDKISPTGIISYSTTGMTNGDVLATLTWLSESVSITNNGWSPNYTFADNGSFTFNFMDTAGNTWSATAIVNNIDKTWIYGTISYSTTGTTSGNVIATIVLSETGIITNNGGASTYNFTDNGSFTFNFVDQAGNTWTAVASVDWIEKIYATGVSISLKSPVTYQVIQRDIATNKWNITIIGNYTGTLLWIEASWNGAQFTNIWAIISWGIFTGTLLNQTWWQGTLIIRASNNSWVLASTTSVGVGDIFIVGWQSNAVGYWSKNQIFTWSNGIVATLFGNDYVWKPLVDPYDSNIGQIDPVGSDSGARWSFVPLLATKIVASQQIPVAFVPSAGGWSPIYIRVPWSNHFDRTTLYWSMAYRIAEVGGKIAGVIWFQWETDAMMKRTTTEYQSNANSMINTLQSDFSGTWPIKFFIGSIGPNNYSGYATDAVRKALQELYLVNPNVYSSTAQTYDIKLADEGADNLHFRSDWDLSAFSERWWNVIAKEYYGLSVNTSPKILSTWAVLYTNTNSLVLTFDTPLSEQVPQAYTNNLSWITYLTGAADAFEITGNTNLSVQSISLSGTNSIVLSLSGSIRRPIYINYANGSWWVNKAIYSTNSYQPAYPIYAMPISIIDNISPEVSLSGNISISIERWSIYIDSGASWSDNVDGIWFIFTGALWSMASFAMSGTVDTNVIGTYYIQYIKVDLAGNIWIATRTISVIDTTAPTWVISYNTTLPTNGNVTATLTWASESITVTNNGGSTSYVFTTNGSFTFEYVDAAGNTGSATATVNNIDKSWISWTIAYSTTWATSGNVTAIITLNKTWTITNNGWSTSYTFTWNGSFIFTYIDQAGNTGSTTATVSNIDKVAPSWVISYSTTWATNGNVIATLTWLSESVTITNNGWSSNYTFTDNWVFTFSFVDAAGNTGSATATVNNIDTTPLPVIDVITNTWSSTSAFTWGAVVLTGTTATWATFWWTWEIIIYASGNVNNSLSFATSGTSIIASWRDSILFAPTITADTWMAQFGEIWVPSQDTSTITRQIVTTIKAWSDVSSLYITGAYFKIAYKVDAGISGDILKIIRSENWNVRESNTPDTQCILDSNKICTFYTDRLSYFATIKETIKQTNSGWGAGWGSSGWGSSSGGGSSDSSSNSTTTVNTWTNNLTWAIVSNNSWNTNATWVILSDYMTAYNWAFENGITTKPTIQEAKIDKQISRAEMAKMISQYAVKVEYKIPNPAEKCNFTDISKVTPDLIPYIKEVCQLGIMGRNSNGTVSATFNPYGLVTRAQFTTMLSRVLYGNIYNTMTWNYRDKHMQILYNQGIIKAMNPMIDEQRWWIFLMLYRASK